MAGKEFTRLGISGWVRELSVDHGVLDIGMSKPILHESNISVGIEEVSSDAMAQTVKFSFLRGKVCSQAILLHEMPEGAAVNRYVSVRDKEIRGVIVAAEEIRADEFLYIGL